MGSPRMHHYSDALVAVVCHDANGGLQKAHERMSLHQDGADIPVTGPFDHMHPDLRAAALNGVAQARRDYPSPREHHQRWVEFLRDRGWKPGPRDVNAKIHPNLVSWDGLPPHERDKCRLFLGIVLAMTINVGET